MTSNRRKNRNTIFAVASLLVIVVACVIAAGCTSASGAAGLAGTSWSLDSYLAENGTLVPVLPGTEVTARFGDDSKVTGSAGCNGYGGSYSLDGTNLSVSSIAQTLKLCLEPEGIMEQEARYLDLLGSAAGYRTENDRLVITDAEGTDLLVFSSDSTTAALAGTSWTLASLAGEGDTMTSVLGGTTVTAVFGADGTISGSAGCNRYNAGYTTNGANLSIEPAARTEMYCSEPEGVMEQEDRYLALLAEVASYRTEGDRLILADGDGADLLVFERTARTPDLPLVGTDWVLESYSTEGAVSSLINGTTITANFNADGSIGGNAGCNLYGGSYSLDGAMLSVSSLYSTLMYCAEPEGVMEQERIYLGHLENASSYRVEGDRLILTDEAGTDLLFFVPAEKVPLAGTSWTLEFYSLSEDALSSTIAGTTITAVFGTDGSVSGNAGCNSYNAGYRLDGEALAIGMPVSTRMYCAEPEGTMEQESRYLGLITLVAGYRIDRDRLDLLDEAGTTLLRYRAEQP